MTLLQIVQQFCLRTGLASPAAVAGSTDRMITQIQGLLNEVLEELTRWRWQQVTCEATFLTTAAEDQGPIDSIATNAFEKVKEKTFFNRTQNLRVVGPLTAEEWQSIQATSFSALEYSWRLRGDRLLLTPVPTAGQTLAFEYLSKAMVYNPNDLEYKQLFTKDNDQFLLDYRLATLGLRWIWKKEKGLAYAEELRSFEELAQQLAGNSEGNKALNMNECRPAVPGVIVPSGNWLQP